jgi:formylmethanofuran dehydrogenase subunit E
MNGRSRESEPQGYHQSMQTFDALLREAEIAHGHLCAGQILGVRLAMLGCQRLGVDDPKGLLDPKDRKRLVTFIEIDRCATDAIAVVTGCRLGKRAIKFRDWGKMAATFVDLASPIGALSTPLPQQNDTHVYKAIRIAALESSKQRARELYPQIENKNQQQMLAYREMPDADLFSEEWVAVPIHPREMPGYKSARITCEQCGEGINYDREVHRNGKTLCEACAAPEVRYYQPLSPEELTANSKAGTETSPPPACEHC